MITVFLVAVLVTGSAYCRSLPPSSSQLTHINVESFNENAVPLIRLARQSGKVYKIFTKYSLSEIDVRIRRLQSIWHATGYG